MLTLLLSVALVAGAVYIYLYYENRSTYWKRRGVPGPASIPLIGNMADLHYRSNPNNLKYRQWTKQYGKYFGLQEGQRNWLVISDPDMLHDLFVKRFDDFYGRMLFAMIGDEVDTDPRIHMFAARGERWKRLRSTANPSFSVTNLKKVFPIVEDSMFETMRLIEEASDDGKRSFNVHRFYQEYTMDVIARIAMGQDGTRQMHSEYIDFVKQVFDRDIRKTPIMWLAFLFPPIQPYLRKLFLRISKWIGFSFEDLFEKIAEHVEQRKRERAAGQVRTENVDFIDLFLDAEVPDVSLDKKDFALQSTHVSRQLSTIEIVAQCFVFLLAGFDTTANSLAYVTYELSKRRDIQQKLQQEIEDVCGNGPIGYDDVHKFAYMDCVVKESLRLYPLGAFANSRRAMRNTRLGDLDIEEGTLVMADTFSLHYDKTLWGPDAEEFRPERWQQNEEGARHPMAWIPFGAGPRICVGMRLALIEEKLLLANLLRRHYFVRTADSEPTLKLVGASTISPVAVTIGLEARD